MANFKVQFIAILLTAIGMTAGSVAYCHKAFSSNERVDKLESEQKTDRKLLEKIHFSVCIIANNAKTLAAIEACKK